MTLVKKSSLPLCAIAGLLMGWLAFFLIERTWFYPIMAVYPLAKLWSCYDALVGEDSWLALGTWFGLFIEGQGPFKAQAIVAYCERASLFWVHIRFGLTQLLALLASFYLYVLIARHIYPIKMKIR